MHAVLEYTPTQTTTSKAANNTAQTTFGRGGNQSNAATFCWAAPLEKSPSKAC